MPGRILSGLHRPSSPSSRSTSRPSSRDHNNSNAPPNTSTESPRLKPQTPAAIPAAAMDSLKRHSLAGMLPGKDSKKSSTPSSSKAQQQRNWLELTRESPPSVFFGPPDVSTGVLLSGVLRVHVVTAPEITLDTFTLRLVARITQKRPVVKDCAECRSQDTEIKSWNFLTERKTLTSGAHTFPFSHLVPGRLPATSYGHLAQIEYFLMSTAKTNTGETMTLTEELKIVRSLAVPNEKQSLRVFPPTRIEAYLTMSPVIHPVGRFMADFSLRGIVNPPHPRRTDVHTRWAIRKLIWKLEEVERTIAPACSRHAQKIGGEGKGKEHTETRILAKEELFEGWKRDYTGAGAIDIEFAVSLTPQGTPGGQKALCDVQTPSGQSITHQMVIELVVAEEWVNNAQPSKWGPTGQARVLRCHFGTKVTERAGLGISWDEEEPPLYQDMKQGPPPDYCKEFGLPPLSDEHIAEMSRRAQREHARVQGDEQGAMPSPPMYGVNSETSEVPLEEIFDELELEEVRRHREERRFGAEDLEWEEDRERRRESERPVEEEEDPGKGPSGVAHGSVE